MEFAFKAGISLVLLSVTAALVTLGWHAVSLPAIPVAVRLVGSVLAMGFCLSISATVLMIWRGP